MPTPQVFLAKYIRKERVSKDRSVGWKSNWKIIKGVSNADILKIWVIIVVYAICKPYMSLTKYYICVYSLICMHIVYT